MNIVFVGGGTAGHVNPALAVADYIKNEQPDSKISFIGNESGMEYKLVKDAGYDFHGIKVHGFQRKISLKNVGRNIAAVYRMLTSTSEAKKILNEIKPDVVVGTGGYVSGPALRVAAKLGIPTAIHEQNAYPGMTTKMLAPLVDRVMLTMPEAEKHLSPKEPVTVTGLPVRYAVQSAQRGRSRETLSLDSRPMILSTGGSLGARTINEVAAAVIEWHAPTHEYYHYHAYGQYGSFLPERLKKHGVDLGASELRITEYISDMDVCLAAADIVIGRAGANTVCELTVQGKPSILIPSPNVSENHQYHNAMTLQNAGAAVVIEEKDVTPEKVIDVLKNLLSDNEKLTKMGESAMQLAIFDSPKRIYDVITEITHK